MNTDFIDCRHTCMLLCFHSNVFKNVVVFLLFIYKCCLVIR